MVNKYERGDMPIISLAIFFIIFVVGFLSVIVISDDFMDKYNTTTTGLMNNTSTAYNMSSSTMDSITAISPMLVLLFAGMMIIFAILYFSRWGNI